MSKVDWSKAPEGATHYSATDPRHPWKMIVDGNVFAFDEDDRLWKRYFRHADALHMIGSFLIERTKQPQAWSGPEDGLPPIGTICEQQTWVNRLWRKVEVVAHFNKFAVCAWEESPGDSQVELAPPYDLRRLTDAIDQRESAIRELMDIAQVDCRVTAARLVDAGFKR